MRAETDVSIALIALLTERRDWLARALLLLLALSTPGTAVADIYAYQDENGVVTLSNHTMGEGGVVLLKETQPKLPAGTAPRPGRTQSFASRPYAQLVDKAAQAQHLDSALIHAVIATESDYNPAAVSPTGARGLMQLMPATARHYDVNNPFDPAQNISAGSRYLRDLLQRYNDDLVLSLAAYNAGEKAVAQSGNKVPPYRETQNYVTRVLDRYHKLVQ